MEDFWDPTRIIVGFFSAVLPIAIIPAPTWQRTGLQVFFGWFIAIAAGPWICERLPWQCDRQQMIMATGLTGLLGWATAKGLLLAAPDVILERLGLGKPKPNGKNGT